MTSRWGGGLLQKMGGGVTVVCVDRIASKYSRIMCVFGGRGCVFVCHECWEEVLPVAQGGRQGGPVKDQGGSPLQWCGWGRGVSLLQWCATPSCGLCVERGGMPLFNLCIWCAACGEAAGLDQAVRQAGGLLGVGWGSCQHSLALHLYNMCADATASCCSLPCSAAPPPTAVC